MMCFWCIIVYLSTHSAMKYKIFTILCILYSFFAVTTSSVQASGMRLIMDGNTYYLSTQEDGSASTRSAQLSATRSAQTSTHSALIRNGVFTPEGFAPNIGDLISFLLKLIMIVALLLVLFAFVMAGFEWITSGGDKGKTESARNRIVAAIVGIIILAAAFALTQLVAYVLGFGSLMDALNSIRPINSY